MSRAIDKPIPNSLPWPTLYIIHRWSRYIITSLILKGVSETMNDVVELPGSWGRVRSQFWGFNSGRGRSGALGICLLCGCGNLGVFRLHKANRGFIAYSAGNSLFENLRM